MAAVVAEYKLEALTAAAGFLLVGACVLPLRPGRVVQALEWRPLAAIGIASYSLYLWHQPILNAFVGLDIAPESFSGLLAVTAPLCLAVAFASYRLVEEPFLRLRRRWAESNPARARPRQRARS
jgi:peptidoglycan/LPS O-acetylase OafA/YrhL